jgi:hypothetical protein
MLRFIRPPLVVLRACSAVKKGTRYDLGKGGRNPMAPSPAKNGACDCSGFVSWAFGLDRKNPAYVGINGDRKSGLGWISTDAIHIDVRKGKGLLFTKIEERRPGAVLVYPDKGGKQGHMAIVVGEHRIVHCSFSNGKRGDAIQITDDSAFNRNDTLIAWYRDFPKEEFLAWAASHLA